MRSLPSRPYLSVREDVLKTLGIARSARSFVVTFNRPNITMTVKSKKSMRDVADFAKWLADRWGGAPAGIVYCLSRDETGQLAQAINDERRRRVEEGLPLGPSAAAYNAVGEGHDGRHQGVRCMVCVVYGVGCGV